MICKTHFNKYSLQIFTSFHSQNSVSSFELIHAWLLVTVYCIHVILQEEDNFQEGREARFIIHVYTCTHMSVRACST